MRLTVPLFVPGDRPDRFVKGLQSGASAIILDLEDAVAPAAKGTARDNVARALTADEALRRKAIVRINALVTPFADADLRALRTVRPAALMIPKCDSASDVRTVAATVKRVEIIAFIESIAGLDAARAIAAEPATTALAFGCYDLAAQLGSLPTWEAMASMRTHVVIAARAAGKLVLDAPFVDLNDSAGLIEEARRAIEFGFDGKMAIHPRHVGPLMEAFAPTESEIDHARRVLAAIEGGGVAAVDGKMVDPPMVASARRVLSRI